MTYLTQSGVALLVGILAAGVMLLAGCSSGAQNMAGKDVTTFASADDGTRALAGDWKVVELDGRAIRDLIPDSDVRRPPMMSIKSDGAVSGFSGVNQFGSHVQAAELTRARFALGPIAMTRMAGPSEMMSVEAKLTMSLSEPRRFSLKDGVLTLMPSEGRADPLVRFRRDATAGKR